MHAYVQNAADTTVDNDWHSDDGIQPLVLNSLVVFVANDVGTRVITNANRTAGGHHASTHTASRRDGEIL